MEEESDIMPQGATPLSDNGFEGLEVIHISKNGYAIVYRARSKGRWFALKALKPEYQDNPLYEGLLRKEYETTHALSHPNIVGVHGFQRVEGLDECILMDYVDGFTLRQRLEKGRLTMAQAKSIISQTCEAMDYIHEKGVIHRDLKPDNIMLTRRGGYVRLIDFGAAANDNYFTLNMPAGTRKYAAPELIRGNSVDGKADIYSLGAVMRQMERHINFGFLQHTRWHNVASRCMASDKSRRYHTGKAVMDALIKKSFTPILIAAGILLALAVTLWLSPLASEKPAENTPVKSERTLHSTYNTQNEARKETNVSTTDRLSERIKRQTVALQQSALRQLADTTISRSTRLDTYNACFTECEAMVRREVNKVSWPDESSKARAQADMHELMRQTYAQFNTSNYDRITGAMGRINKEKTGKPQQ